MTINRDFTEKHQNQDEVYAVNTPTAAKFIGCSEALLRKFRSEGTGPAYSRLGSKIVYPLSELKRYLKKNLVE